MSAKRTPGLDRFCQLFDAVIFIPSSEANASEETEMPSFLQYIDQTLPLIVVQSHMRETDMLRARLGGGGRRLFVWCEDGGAGDLVDTINPHLALYHMCSDQLVQPDIDSVHPDDLRRWKTRNRLLVELLNRMDFIQPATQDIYDTLCRSNFPRVDVLAPLSEMGGNEPFEAFFQAVLDGFGRREPPRTLLVLYDDKFATMPAIEWHLRSFEKYSRHQVVYLPGSIVDGRSDLGHVFEQDPARDLLETQDGIWDLSIFDAIVVHFSLRTTTQGYVPRTIIDLLAQFDGPKILFIQDEYDHVSMTWDHIRQMGITDVFTCVPESGWTYVYPEKEVPGLNFIPTHTGYVPEDTSFTDYALPLEERKRMIGYRGRQLPHHYGMLGYEKFIIGHRMKAECAARHLPADIETDDAKRIYAGWYQFLGSCRATLGTESGNNIFDFDDVLRQKAADMADQPFEEVYETHFKPFEAPFEMNQISPKFFEAILMRTALICFPGSYSGILEADRHYIRLEKDFSNVDEVLAKVADAAFLQKITEQAYDDIIRSGAHSYQTFIKDFDAWLDQRVPSLGTRIVFAPIAAVRGNRVRPVRRRESRDVVFTATPLGGNIQREDLRAPFRDPHIRLTGFAKVRAVIDGFPVLHALFKGLLPLRQLISSIRRR